MPSSHPDNTQELEQIREIMREWEGLFPFPEYEDESIEVEIAYKTANKIQALITQSNLKAVEGFAERLKNRPLDSYSNLPISAIDQELAKLKENK